MSDMRKDAIGVLVAKHGSYRAAGRVLGLTGAYLWRIAQGQKDPSEEVLKKLNLRREVHYEWRKPLKQAASNIHTSGNGVANGTNL